MDGSCDLSYNEANERHPSLLVGPEGLRAKNKGKGPLLQMLVKKINGKAVKHMHEKRVEK